MSKTFDAETNVLYAAAKAFVDAYEQHESPAENSDDELPEPLDVYRDVFGNKYLVLSVVPPGVLVFGEIPTVVLSAIKRGEIFTLPLADFLNPEFVKVD